MLAAIGRFPIALSNTEPQRGFCRSNGPVEGNVWGLPWCKNLWYFFFVSLARAKVWPLFDGLSTPLLSLFYVIREFDRFLH